jgi:hypothetical protein
MSYPSLPGAEVPDFQRVHLQRLKLAADVLLGEAPHLTTALEAELSIYRERIECALLESTTTAERP